MQVDWEALSRQVGSLDTNNLRSGGTFFAELACKRLVGEDAIRDAVDLILQYRAGSELAENVLQHITSQAATDSA